MCGENAYVAVGFDPLRWLCMDHFNEYLKNLRKTIDKAKDAVTGPIPEDE